MEIVLTESQKQAVDAVQVWLRNPTAPQVFRLYGFAGTGKTTIIKTLVEHLGLVLDEDVIFATLTGKAAQVMRRISNLPCLTIHTAAYHYVKADVEEMENLENKIKAMQEFGEDAEVKTLQDQLWAIRTPSFVVNSRSRIGDAKLLVLDECSMIDEKVARDLVGFNTRILLIGDPGQLPPISGNVCGGFGDEPPDVFLDEIHRQALDSPILQLATLARQGKRIPVGAYGGTVAKAPFEMFEPKDLVGFDQVICGTHKTRRWLNRELRKAKSHTGDLPTGPTEKIIVLRNYSKFGLLNGQFITLNNVTKKDEHRLFADVTTEDGEFRGNLVLYSGYFLDNYEYIESRIKDDYNVRQKGIECDFAEAITCHKAQGSQWKNVCVVDDGWGWREPDQRRRWLYTAITRASDGLMILDKKR